MEGLVKTITRGAAALGLLAALGFGAAQALAAPAAAETAARACSPLTCAASCFNRGYDLWYCSDGVCHCGYRIPPE
jgi:hypothetical protein